MSCRCLSPNLAGFGRDVESACRVYRPRDARKTALWGLLDTLYERVKGEWEERFERRYGFWRGLADEVVARYLDCGDWNSGFARVRCRKCPEEFLVAFSCRGRGLCPSCGAKRAAEELFRHKVLALLRRRGLLSEERIDLLLSRRRSGFSVAGHAPEYQHLCMMIVGRVQGSRSHDE